MTPCKICGFGNCLFSEEVCCECNSSKNVAKCIRCATKNYTKTQKKQFDKKLKKIKQKDGNLYSINY